ncbi:MULTISPECIES: histidine kinase dimerization/phosphoacceptor domain -containing protein [unclassified Rhizobium]|uniref:histidine kinase dimerization/phosphoacceptor domain -containing protein n=1 Tax=unclassified Rhizobium TaxID=2613769 RepID=UPI00178674A5|nr:MULTISPECIES: histidine kinase dimerization/phosphoacceptor domain -containing protein [unclassified Rhizobium]MBD8689581.1 PAS domain-containing protein [Rhizobium sp. CFBP 13644]MBD8693897.1 PAS domain-containing protein [Rhizobium sp. CFBP 13717]
MDVTESVLKAKEADARLRVALHAADLASWEYEPETDIWRRSHSVDVIFGFEPGQGGPVAAPFFARMHPDDLPSVRQVVADFMACPDRTTMMFDYRIVLPSGEVKFVTSRGEVLRTSTGKVRMIGVLMDVTADRLREAILSEALAAQAELTEQKELLLAEVNHRVKNSLQLVVSTLRLQARTLQDPATKAAFDLAISRVRAIISVHERLYRDRNSLRVDMADHLSKLCLDLVADGSRAITVDADALELPTERAIPISVIVNELLAGALRGADEEKPITVSLKTAANGQIKLEVLGAQLVSPVADGDLGSRLIATMATQLGGVVAASSARDGYRFMLAFEGTDR